MVLSVVGTEGATGMVLSVVGTEGTSVMVLSVVGTEGTTVMVLSVGGAGLVDDSERVGCGSRSPGDDVSLRV